MADNNRPPLDAVHRKDADATSAASVKEPFYDIVRWGTKPPEGEELISTAYGDKVTRDLAFVEAKPGVHKPDPILVADNVVRRFGGMNSKCTAFRLPVVSYCN